MSIPTVNRLSNGLTVVVVEQPGSHQVLVNLLVRVGSRYETPVQSGISHFLEHMLFRGCKGLPTSQRIYRAFEGIGGIPNAITGVETTEFYFTAHPSGLAEGLQALTRLAAEPLFVEIEKERSIIQDEILYDYNDKGELIHLGALAAELMWPGHPLGQSVTGTTESVAKFGEAALRAHHVRHYTPNNMVLGICGKVDLEAAVSLADRYFSPWPVGREATNTAAGNAPALSCLPASRLWSRHRSRPTGPIIKTVHDGDNQFHLQLSFPAPGYNDPLEIPMVLLSRLLDDGPNSRLQRVIREEQALVYQVGGDYSGFMDTGQFDITTSVKAQRLPELLAALIKCLRDFRDKGPTDDELAMARKRHGIDLEFGLDSLQARLDRHAWPLLNSTVRGDEEEMELINGVGKADLQLLANQIFQREKSILVLVGPVTPEVDEITNKALEEL